MKRPAIKFTLLIVGLIANLCVALLCWNGFRYGPFLLIDVIPGSGDCHWEVTNTDELLSTIDPQIRRGDLCLVSIEGVQLGRHGLVREPTYLDNAEEYNQWLIIQSDLHERLSGRQTVSARFEQNGEAFTVDLRLQPFSMERLDSTTVFLLVIIAISVTISGFVFWKRPSEPSAISLYILCNAIFIAFVTNCVMTERGISMSPWDIVIIREVNLLGNLVGVLAFIFLVSNFPQELFGRKSRLLSIAIPVPLAAAAVVLEFIGFFGATLIILSVLVFVALILMILAQLRPATPVAQLQARWILWAFAVPIIVWLITRASHVLGVGAGPDPTDEIVAVAGLSIPVGLAVAILKYRLLDIEVVIRRTILGGLVTLFVLFVYHLVVSTFASRFAESTEGAAPFSSIFISAIVLTFMLVPAQARLEGFLDRIFFRNRFHYRRLLRQIPDELAGLASIEQTACQVLERIGSSMETPKLVVALAPDISLEDKCWTRESKERDSSREELCPPEDDAFWDHVGRLGLCELLQPADGEGALALWMKKNDLHVALPLTTPDDLVGVLACKGFAGAGGLTSEDAELLRSVAAALALAISRSLAYETIRRLNEELEQKVTDRTNELEKARLKLYQWEKMASLGVLAAGVAHELNTPLEVVMTSSEQLASAIERAENDGGKESKTLRLAKLCREGATRAGAIIRDLRTFSRPETQDLDHVDLHVILDSTLSLLVPMLKKKGIKVHTQWCENLPHVEGFVAMINQTVTNIIVNAAAAIGQDGEIRIQTENIGGDRVRITVEDSGPGIEPAIRDRIFEPFFTTKPPGEGTGLGLSLCFTMIEQHGGKIWEEGEPGKGARFVVELPIKHPGETIEQRSHHSLIPE